MVERLHKRVLLMVHALVHEVRDAFVCELIDHFDFNLGQCLSALFAALRCRLELKVHLVSCHVNFSDRLLGSVGRNHDAIGVVRRGASDVNLRERLDALEHDVDKLDVKRRSQDRIKRLVLGLELVDALTVLELGLVHLTEELVNDLEEQDAEERFVESGEGQENARGESHHAAQNGNPC